MSFGMHSKTTSAARTGPVVAALPILLAVIVR